MIRVGTSGWQYADWRGHLYPAGVPQRILRDAGAALVWADRGGEALGGLERTAH